MWKQAASFSPRRESTSRHGGYKELIVPQKEELNGVVIEEISYL